MLDFKKLPLYLQHEQSECGYACIAMIAVYFGHDLDLSYLRTRFSSSTQGMNLQKMQSIFCALHFESQALGVALQDLHQLPLPVVLHWNFNHFVVLKKIRGKRYWVHDPAVGERVCHLSELSRFYTGVTLTVQPLSDFKALQVKQKLTIVDFVRSVSKGRALIGLAVVLSVLAESGQMLQAFLMQYMTDSIVGMRDGVHMMWMAISLTLIFLFFSGLEYIKGGINLSFSTQLKTQFSLNAMRHLVQLPMSYFENRSPGQLHLIFQSIDVIQRKCGVGLIQGFTDAMLLLLHGLMMVYYSAMLTLIVAGSLCVTGGCRFLSYVQLRQGRQRVLTHHGKMLSIFLETIQMMMPLKAHTKEIQKWTQWRHAYVDTLNTEFQIMHVQLMEQVFTKLITSIEYVLLVCFGSYLIGQGSVSLGMLIAFLSFRLGFLNRLNQLAQWLLEYGLMDVDLERVQDFVVQTPERLSGTTPTPVAIRGDLSLEAITYTHAHATSPILKEVSFTVEAGEKIVITGPSGCGKTTLMKIMMGLVQAQSGALYLDGYALSELGLSAYRKHMACVLQTNHLVNGSIRENIVFFEDQFDLYWLEEVARLAVIHDVIMRFPMQYETKLCDLGPLLSGGERQRLLLARALYKRPKLLFLDEATSHLDRQTEQQVNENLRQLNMTQIMVAHRQETIAMAERVIQLSLH